MVLRNAVQNGRVDGVAMRHFYLYVVETHSGDRMSLCVTLSCDGGYRQATTSGEEGLDGRTAFLG